MWSNLTKKMARKCNLEQSHAWLKSKDATNLEKEKNEHSKSKDGIIPWLQKFTDTTPKITATLAGEALGNICGALGHWIPKGT